MIHQVNCKELFLLAQHLEDEGIKISNAKNWIYFPQKIRNMFSIQRRWGEAKYDMNILHINCIYSFKYRDASSYSHGNEAKVDSAKVFTTEDFDNILGTSFFVWYILQSMINHLWVQLVKTCLDNRYCWQPSCRRGRACRVCTGTGRSTWPRPRTRSASRARMSSWSGRSTPGWRPSSTPGGRARSSPWTTRR